MRKTKISIKTDTKLKALDKYAGKWVAFWDGKVVAHKRNLKRLMREVKKLKGVKKPSVLLVPKKDEGPYVI